MHTLLYAMLSWIDGDWSAQSYCLCYLIVGLENELPVFQFPNYFRAWWILPEQNYQ